jgi:hypothetical protein
LSWDGAWIATIPVGAGCLADPNGHRLSWDGAWIATI